MVVFASLEFMFRFLPVLLLIYYITPNKYKEMILLAGSIIFYASGERTYIFLLIILTVLNHLTGRFIWKINQEEFESKDMQRNKNICFLLILLIDAGVLMIWKYLQFKALIIQLPLGISFYVFKMISYQADLYRDNIKEKPVFRKTALYFMIFTQVASGPIMNYQEGGFSKEKQFSKGRAAKYLETGLQYFIMGLAMKVLLADRLAILWNDILTIGVISISTPLAWLGIIAYSLQLYFDFWGYSLMASGIGVMFGYDFILNFNHPYAARSISEYYRRWHITLGRWFREYIYIPLGGNRVSKKRLMLNLGVVWVLTGLWHGSGFNYLLWGICLGCLIIIEKLWLLKWLDKVPLVGRIYTIFFILLTWVIFVIPEFADMGMYFKRLFPFFTPTHYTVNKKDFINYLQLYWKLLLVGVIFCIPVVYEWINKHKRGLIGIAFLLILFWVSIYYLVNAGSNPFLYFSY